MSSSDLKYRVAAGSYERFLLGYDCETSTSPPAFNQCFSYGGHIGPIKCVAAMGDVAVTGGSDDIIRVYDVAHCKDMGPLHHHKGSINCVELHGPPSPSPSPSHLLAGSDDGSISVWQADTSWKCLTTLKGHKGPVNDLSVHPSGRLSLSVSRDGSMRMWNLLRARGSFRIKLRVEPLLVQFSPAPDAALFAIALRGGSVQLHHSADAQTCGTLPHAGAVLTMHFVNEHLLATAGEERCIYLWDIRQPATATAAFIPDAHSSRIRGLAALPSLSTAQQNPNPSSPSTSSPSPSSLPLLLSAASDGCLRLWDLRKLMASSNGFTAGAAGITDSNGGAGNGSVEKPEGPAGRRLSGSPLASMQTGARITCLAVTSLRSRSDAEEGGKINGAVSGPLKHKESTSQAKQEDGTSKAKRRKAV